MMCTESQQSRLPCPTISQRNITSTESQQSNLWLVGPLTRGALVVAHGDKGLSFA